MSDYDVIVVGAGAAGVPLAVRLSEDGRKVLLLEAGKDYTRTEDFPPELQRAATMEAMVPGNPADWGFKGQLTKEVNVVVNRGKILGGSTALNGTYFVRARKTDFDGWSQGGNDLWKFDNVLKYYKRSETDTDYGATEVHGGDGPMRIRRVHDALKDPFYKATLEASAELGHPEEADKNDQQAPGYGLVTLNNVDGLRWNTGIGYINPRRAELKNLTIQGETFVRRVVFEGKRAVGVEVDYKGETKVIKAGLVVLTAGAMKTPHILMLSGIGPEAELSKFGIPVIHNAPGVGKGFSDHPDVMVPWQPKVPIADYDNPISFGTSLNFDSGEDGYVNDIEFLMGDKPFGYLLSGKPEAWRTGASVMFSHPLRSLKAIFGTSLKQYMRQMLEVNNNSIQVLLQKQASRGNISLVSADPKVYPQFDYNYFTEEVDRRRMRNAIRHAIDLLHTSAFADLFKNAGELDDPKLLNDDAALDAYYLKHLITGIHMAGTAPFSTTGGSDPMAVVDQSGKVLGVEGLRIADTSILPDTTSRGPAATAVMLGEFMSDVIIMEDGGKGYVDPTPPKKAK